MLNRIDRVPGTVLRQVVEHSIVWLANDDAAMEPEGQFMQFSGLTFSWAYCGKTPVVRQISVGGEPLDPAKLYSVATGSFIAMGGDSYTMFLGLPHSFADNSTMSVSDIGVPLAKASVM